MKHKLYGATLIVFVSILATLVLRTYWPITTAKTAVNSKAVKSDAIMARGSMPYSRSHPANLANRSQESKVQFAKSYGKLPLSFEANLGQTDSRVKFLSRGGGYTLFLTSTEAVLSLSKTKPAVASKDIPPDPLQIQRGINFHPRWFRRGMGKSPQGLLDQFRGSAALFNFPRFPGGELLNSLSLISQGRNTIAESQAPTVLQLKLAGANRTPRINALEKQPGKSNYFIGKDPKKWRTDVPNFGRVKYEDVYPGVDLVYYGNQGQLEYDFIVAPGADPRAIKLDIQGSKKVKVEGRGDLVVDMGDEEICFHKPVIYQAQSTVDIPPQGARASATDSRLRTSSKHFLDGSYMLNGKNEVTFEIASYDKTRPLVIDPVLRYSTYLGGSGDDLISPTGVQGIAVDPEGNAYVIGVTDSSDFPVTTGAFQTKLAGSSGTVFIFPGDVFVTKLNAKGDAVVYSTYLGGTNDDSGEGIAVDPAGNAYLAGETLSTDFPITEGAFQAACSSCSNGAPDTFAAKLSRDGSALVYSTYIGGSDWDLFPMIAIDRSGNTYIEGSTFSADFPTTKGAFQTACPACANGFPDTYVTKLNPEGTGLVYSTYLGGSDEGICGSQIAVDSVGSAYVNGFTCSTDFPTLNPLQANAGGCDAFLTKLNPAGNALVYSTYLGGSDFEFILGTAIDSAGNAYVSGFTFSSDFPTTSGAFDTTYNGGTCGTPPDTFNCPDAFVTKVNARGNALVYSTYLGGTGDDSSAEIVVDSDGNTYVGGNTSSTDFPTLNAFQPANAGGYDIFVTELNAAGNALVYSTYLGGSSDEGTSGMAIDSRRNVYLEGNTTSTDFLAVNPVQPQFGGGTFDALLAKISPIDAPGLGLSRLSVEFPAQPPGTTSPPQTFTVHSVGSQPLFIREILTAPSSQFAQTNTCTQALAPGESCTISVTFTSKAEGESEGVLVLVANSSPASGRVRLTVTDQAVSVPAQGATASRPGQASTVRPNGAVRNWRTAIIRRRATH